MSGISDKHAALLRDMQYLDIPSERLSDISSGFADRSYLLQHSMEVDSTIPQEPVKRRLPSSTSRADGRQTSGKCSHDCQISQAASGLLLHKVTSDQQLLASETILQPRIVGQAQALDLPDIETTQQQETGPIGHDKHIAKLKIPCVSLARSLLNIVKRYQIISSYVGSVEIGPSMLTDDLWHSGMREDLHTQSSRQDFSGHKQSHNLEFHSFLPKKSTFCWVSMLLRTRTWLDDRLLSLLRRKQDSKSSQHLLEAMRLSSISTPLFTANGSILKDLNTAFMLALAHVEAALNHLKLRSLRIHDELWQKDGLIQTTFEFPNNFRLICTTMPWTIAPALLVLWGVCWMFFGSPSPPHQKPVAAEPVTSPSPAFYDFLEGCPGTDPSDYLQYLNTPYLDGDGNQDFVQDSVHDGLDTSGFIDPLSIIQDTPRDPDFLTVGTPLQTINSKLEMLGQESDDTRWLPEASASDIQPQSYQVTDHQPATNVSDQESESQCASRQKEPRFVCQDCQQPFATSFTLNRHRREAHAEAVSTVENLFPCPSPHCKRSKERSPFKRLYNLKRHLENCKYGKEIAKPLVEQISPLITPTLTPPSPDKLPEPEVSLGVVVRSNETKKRIRSEDKENVLGDTCLMDDVIRRYKRMAQEVKEKEVEYLRKKKEYLQSLDDLKLLEKIIQNSKSSYLDS